MHFRFWIQFGGPFGRPLSVCICPIDGKLILAKTNYSFEKRQRELDKKRKAEEKRLRKHDGKGGPDEPAEGEAAADEGAPPLPVAGSLPPGGD